MNMTNYTPGNHPDLPPPAGTVGPMHWLRTNLFSSPANIIVTLIVFWVLYKLLPPMVDWFFLDSVLTLSLIHI